MGHDMRTTEDQQGDDSARHGTTGQENNRGMTGVRQGMGDNRATKRNEKGRQRDDRGTRESW